MAGTTLEVNNASSSVCRMCGTAYGKLSGYFYKSYSQLYRGIGYLPICKSCLDFLYDGYLAECSSPRDAVRQICRKLDLYWDDGLYTRAEQDKTARTVLASYISKINTFKNNGKSYDDTLKKENALWNFATQRAIEQEARAQSAVDREHEYSNAAVDESEIEPVSQDIKDMWGSGYSDDMYRELEDRRQYWMKQLISEGVDVNNVGTQALLRQIVSAELDINKSRAAGEDVDKKVNTFKSLLSDAMLKPSQKKGTDATDAEIDKTPFGVWIRRWEDKRPIPEPDKDLQDVDGIIKYISIWFYGHLCKFFNIKNSYNKLYEDKIAEMRVDRPEFDEDDDESFFNNLFDNEGGDEDG